MTDGFSSLKSFIKYSLLAYVMVVLVWGIFCVLSLKFPALYQLALRINKPVAAAAAEGEIVVSPNVIMGTAFDPNGHFRILSEYDPSQVDYWIIILDQFSDIQSHSLAEPLGLLNHGIAETSSGSLKLFRSRALTFRVHPLPLYVRSQNVLVIEAKTIVENYESECIGDIFFKHLAGTMSPEFMESCSQ